jgi:hypothetical protein
MNSIDEYLESLLFDVTTIDLSSMNLTEIPNLNKFTKITNLDCSCNQLKELKNLPNTLETLKCNNNQFKELKDLPNTLQSLCCNDNQLKELNNLPNALYYLECNNNQLIKLDKLSNMLRYLYCSNNQLIKLKNLPNTLLHLYCQNNQLKELHLPSTLNLLCCEDNQLLFTNLAKIFKLNKFIKFYHGNKLFKFIFYNFIKKRCSKYKEELIAQASHPSRIFKYLNDNDELDTFMENI